jgi:hypothetical protein
LQVHIGEEQQNHPFISDFEILIGYARFKELKMNRRLYFLLPNAASAHEMMNDLLLARVNEERIHFIARSGMSLGNLPKANVRERTELINGWEIGMGLGTVLGLIAGLVALALPTWWFTEPLPTVIVPICMVIGFISGGLWTAMVATAVPNQHVKQYERQIAHGKVLMIVLVPFHRINEIRRLEAQKHPHAL